MARVVLVRAMGKNSGGRIVHADLDQIRRSSLPSVLQDGPMVQMIFALRFCCGVSCAR